MKRTLVLFCLLLGAVTAPTAEAEISNKDDKRLQNPPEGNINPTLEARDCSDYYNFGRRTKSGVYVIRPDGFKDSFPVYCEMEKYGGGWSVIQRRGNYGFPNDYFYKNWAEYKEGFGNLEFEFWLGNDKISSITKQGKYTLQVDLIDVNWNLYNYTYGLFEVDNELELYRLKIDEYSGKPSDSIFHHDNGMRFTTQDRDNDMWSDNCAKTTIGAWWYAKCGLSTLNSLKFEIPDNSHFRIRVPVETQLRYSQLMIRK